ncbi:MAG: DUF3987 domain-containing protein [Chloroflexi bacterium]|nr:DUF3987 domain-containing protein [Chloroflexota bacterium]
MRSIDPHTEADKAAILMTFLVYFGNAVGRGPHGVAEQDRHGCNLFVNLVGETSKGRKGSSQGHIRELFARVDPTWTDNNVLSGLSSGEGLIAAVRDRVTRVKDGEEEVIDPGVSDKRLLVAESEFAGALKVMSREGNTLSAILRQAFDSGTLRILTKNSPAKATGAHISILGHVTKTELLRYLNDTEYANGFANRFLWVCVKRSKVLPEGGGIVDHSNLIPRLREALEKARRLDVIRRNEEAREIWAAVYPSLSDGKPGLFGAVTARAEALVLRLSVLYAALDGSPEIKGEHLRAALAAWEYSEQSAAYIFGGTIGDPISDKALALLRGSEGKVAKGDLFKLFKGHVAAERLDQALRILKERGLVDYQTVDTGGRPGEYWEAVHGT